MSVMEALPYAVVIINREGHILFINEQTEKIFGYNRNELLGRFVETLVPEHLRERHSGHRANYISHLTTRPMGIGLELTGRRKDGTEIPVEISLSPVSVREQIFVTALIQNITDRKRMEEALRESERRFRDLAQDQERQLILSERLISFGEMTASLAHEFNNPLGIVIGFAQDLLTEVDPTDPRYQSVKIIEEEARRCKKIMQDLLDFGRQATPQFTQMDPMEMIRKSIDLLTPRFHKANIRPVIQDRNGLPKIWVDPQQVGQVLVNLFFNAIEAMPDGGTLTVSLTAKPTSSIEDQEDSLAGGPASRTDGDEVIITVTDTGQGIDPDHLSKIFHPFFTTKSKKGMGLGLSICKSIMEAHGGRISAETVPGRGTTFYLHLPVDRRRSPRDESVSS
ncbi:MAG: PAS domain S-box protein [Nitrospirae bacterium]|nr:PAS domain S-box protein [Nitrospirota bacterium]